MDHSRPSRIPEAGDLSVLKALRCGDVWTKCSAVLMGLGNIRRGQAVKGVMFLAAEALYFVFMCMSGFHNLAMLPSLGTRTRQEIWDEAQQVYLYTQGDRSILILLYGLATVLFTILMIWAWRGAVKSAYRAELLDQSGRRVPSFRDDIRSLFDGNLHRLLMTPPFFFILFLSILPLAFMICMAFTSYSRVDGQLVLFHWVGLKNFASLFDRSSALGGTFWRVLIWTLVWAVFATFTNYFFGMGLAILINRSDTRAKGFWRGCFVISCAVPMFVSLLIMRTMLQPEGAVNVLLREIGLIPAGASLPFFTNTAWARITVIVINIWVGVPYTLIQLTGILQNIPRDLYEAAEIDGAGKLRTFRSITLPYMFRVTTPYLISTFTSNINGFAVIYLLTGGDPVTDLASTAGDTDLLVTWLYKLTIDKQFYNIGAVIGVLSFVILALGTILTYRRSKSYRETGGF